MKQCLGRPRLDVIRSEARSHRRRLPRDFNGRLINMCRQDRILDQNLLRAVAIVRLGQLSQKDFHHPYAFVYS